MLREARNSFGVRLAIILILIMGMLGIYPTEPVLAATITVTNANDSGAGSLRQVIADAANGDTITFDPSLAGQTITLTSQLTISKNLTLDGSALTPPLILSGGDTTRIIQIIFTAQVTISHLVFTRGFSTTGGAIDLNGSTQLTLENSTFHQNQSSSSGGAVSVRASGVIMVINSVFDQNQTAGSGGAISGPVLGAATIISSTFSDNVASADGGAISGASITLTDCTFSNNIAGGGAGAILAFQSTIKNTVIYLNQASYGGAIVIPGNSWGRIINSTITQNQANVGGGAIYAQGAVDVEVWNSTFAGNRAPEGSEINVSGQVHIGLVNTILACVPGNNGCIFQSGNSFVSSSNSIIDTGSFVSFGLGELADNGGPTKTMALLPGSPLIDAGDDTVCANSQVNNLDQRGITRPKGTHCDIGAYEFEAERIEVTIGETGMGPSFLVSGESIRKSYTGVNNGLVKIINTDNDSLIAAERVIYRVNNVNTSFSEMMALPDSQLDTTYWLPWYNNVDLDTQLRFGNVSGSSATVNVYIGGTLMTPTPITLLPGESTRQSFGTNNGLVQIMSDQNIVAAERVIYKVNNINTSFSELMALPNNQLSETYWLPWYNNVDLDTQLRFANVTGSTATVHVLIGGVEMTGSPFILAPGESTRQSFAINNGPVKIVSDQNIVAAERVIYKVNNIPTSFSEMMALPNGQLNTTYWLPWYNNVDLDTQLRFANVSGSTATVHVFIGGVEMTGSPFILSAGQSTRQSFAVNNGPAQIVSDQNIVAAERVIYKVNNIPTSFSEMMALPNSQLDSTYWLPWYNNIDLDTQLRFGVP